MRRLVGSAVAIVLTAVVVGPTTAQAAASSDSFYRPSAAKTKEGKAGTVIHSRPATGVSVLPDAGRVTTVIYRSTNVNGKRVAMSGTVLLPHGKAPRGGWPLVTWGHMTTGAADVCAVSSARSDASELDHMTQGDAVVSRLLRAGVAVAKPDYEGVGTAGPHPYLIGDSLATSTIDLAAAARRLNEQIGSKWVAAGQSEGGVAALFVAEKGRRLPSGLKLVGVSAFVPPTRMDTLIQLFQPIPLALGAETTGQLVALSGLIMKGAATVDPVLAAHLPRGGLSDRAWALWPHLEDRCFNDLTSTKSWGGLAPSQVAGRQSTDVMKRLMAVVRDNDVRNLNLRSVPVRIDIGILDVVVPIALSEGLLSTYRSRGVNLTTGRWLAGHSQVTDEGQSAAAASQWIISLLKGR